MWIMSFDFGLNRIGVAICNTELKIPHPVTVITGRNKFEKLDKIEKLVQEWKPGHLVVGMPEAFDTLNINGNANNAVKIPTEQQKLKNELIDAINKFANRLKHKFKLPVSFINESYSSQIASNKLKQQNIKGKQQVGKLDMLAACEILQRYLDNELKG